MVPNPTVFLEGEAPFSSSLPLRPPLSLPLIYLSKSLIFCILEEDVNGKEFPCPGPGSERGRRATRLPQGREAKVTGTEGAGRRGVWGRGLLLPAARRTRTVRGTDPGAAVVATRVHTRGVPIPPEPRALPAGPRSCGRRPTRDQAGQGRRPAPTAQLPPGTGPVGGPGKCN